MTALAVAATAALLPVAAAGPALAVDAPAAVSPAGTSADGSRIVSVRTVDDRHLTLQVYSAAMDKNIEVDVQRPADTSAAAPTLYLLNGAGGGEDSATWNKQTDVLGFLAAKDVNVVQPIGGGFSYYTDWRAPDPALGVNKWKTFLTEELPPLVDRALHTTGRNAIAGLSMAGTSVLQLPIAAPGLYGSVASYSGCAQISDPIGYNFVNTVVAAGGGDAKNMYGPQGDPMWTANDPYVRADQLRGVNLFISSGTGMPGRYDTLDGQYALPGPGGLANQVVVGGGLEAATDYCTRNLQTRLNDLGIPATYDFTPTGTHSWGYWQDALEKSWPVLAAGLGLPA
ncbi:esterase family protein [Nocardia otitidiscaviarum]|uniref:Esterase family protein n=1 Tax=Nocardia otitidiscaviarum TaxID=1823 RepID=A0A516NJR4_9NOCA|nr:alpha/beta hydrolase family protein [Nocardia otitidiscaviarum]MCP9619017.1 esterase family protein [Nocardia otitidiscaviarum]QDP79135.1 esterase family protein [Nocardia otitidiscaviarum]